MRLTQDTTLNELLHSEDELTHYGIKGMKWGVRRYQNKDGTLTAKGKERYRDTKSGSLDEKYDALYDEDGKLTQHGRNRLQGFDGQEGDNAQNHQKAEEYVWSYERKYGSTPVNRLRFRFDSDIRRGRENCEDYDWNNTSLDDIYDAYKDYRESQQWD